MNSKLMLVAAFAAGALAGVLAYRTTTAAAEGRLNTQDLKAGLNALSRAFSAGRSFVDEQRRGNAAGEGGAGAGAGGGHGRHSGFHHHN